MLYLDWNDALVFNGDGKFVTESVTVDENSEAYHSCLTMLNGEAVIFGGDSDYDLERQVTHPKRKYVEYLFFRYPLYPVAQCDGLVNCHLIL